MADSNRSTNAHLDEIQDGDPFAELTRIMGHDPRSDKEKAENADGGESAGGAGHHDEDLAIDLESELMGGLSSFEEEQAPPTNEVAPEEANAEGPVEGREPEEDAANENLDEALSDLDLEMDFDAAFAEEEATPAEAPRDFPLRAHRPELADGFSESAAEPETSEEEGPVFLRIGASPPEAEPETARHHVEWEDVAVDDDGVSDLEREVFGEEPHIEAADDGALNARDREGDNDLAENHRQESRTSAREGGASGEENWEEERQPASSARIFTAAPFTPGSPLPGSTGAEHQAEAEPEQPFETEDASLRDEPVDESQEHFPPLYAGHQPEMETEEQTDTGDASLGDETAEAFDYSRAAADRHDFLAETLEDESPATRSEEAVETNVGGGTVEAVSGPEGADVGAVARQDDETPFVAGGGADHAFQDDLTRPDEGDEAAAEPFAVAPPDFTGRKSPETWAEEADDPSGEEAGPVFSTHDVERDAHADAHTEETRQGDPLGVLEDHGARPMRTPTMMAPAAAMAASPAVDRWTEQPADDTDAETEADGPETEFQQGFMDEAATTGPSESPAGPPEIETVDIAERPAAVEDDLDIPDVKAEEEAPPAIEFDDFEAELAGAFGSLSGKAAPDEEDDLFAQEVERQAAAAANDHKADAESGMVRASGTFTSELHEAPHYDGEHADGADAEETGIDAEYAGAVGRESADLYYDPAAAEDMAYTEESAVGGTRRRGILVASLVAIIAVIGGIGAFALSSGNDTPSSPAVVQAGDQPVKVKPENPGGAKVPNQDSEVYQRVAGKDAGEPAQEKLVSTTEEPMDVTGPEPRVVTPQAITAEGADTSASTKSEQRLAPSGAEDNSQIGNEVSTVKARRVKTVVVKPDGTIVSAAAESAQPATTSDPASSNVAAENDAASINSANEAIAATGMVPPAGSEATNAASGSLDEATASSGSETESGDDAAQVADDGATATEPTPLPTARPSGQTQTQDAPQVASTNTESQTTPSASDTAPAAGAATSAPTSEWSVQVSSQPSVKAAQQSYQNMAQRYGDILSGQGVNIVRADIDGKGTYYRVRIPSASKDDAIALCSKLKSAGGSCFVSK